MPKKPTKSRSEAHVRGWITRRAKAAAREAAFERRSAAAKKGHATKRAREREDFGPVTGEDWIIEEPIDVVGGKKYKKKGK